VSVAVLVSAMLVGVDAHRLAPSKGLIAGNKPVIWFLGCLAAWLIVYPYYLWKRSGLGRKPLAVFGLLSALAMVGSSAYVAVTLAADALEFSRNEAFLRQVGYE
jgi:hypothetical protein